MSNAQEPPDALRQYTTLLECALRAIIQFNGCGVSVEIAQQALKHAPKVLKQ